ncbi:hypothetical protein [Anaerovorax odorimutans]|uniref:hypothetical protein n=1 Tax=Anaerovorax odorimutans TaxID=109327 RepID=UPI0004210F7C|nr:hypothetical protein [Anaerovorax odorimutans]
MNKNSFNKEETIREKDDVKIIKTKRKKIVLMTIIICFLILAAVLIIGVKLIMDSFSPTPNNERNKSTTNITMMVPIQDNANRKAIVRTYTAEEFDQFDSAKLNKIKETVSGNIEGDIPALYLKDDKGILYFSFQKDQKEVTPDFAPKIKITAFPSMSLQISKEQENKINQGQLTEDTNKTYSYEIQRYYTQDEKLFVESALVEIRYFIDGNEYVSMFGVNTTNAGKNDDFFEND